MPTDNGTDLVVLTKSVLFDKVLYWERVGAVNQDVKDWATALFTADISGKADKVGNATAGNFAGLDSNGNLTDSGKGPTSFALASHNHDTRYLRKNASDVYDTSLNGGQLITFSINGGLPFTIDNVGDDPPSAIPSLNASFLNGHADTYFAPKNHNHNTLYYLKSEVDGFLTAKLGVITAGGAPTLNVVLAAGDGTAVYDGGVALDALATVTSLSDYYTKTEADGLLANKMNLHGGSTYTAGIVPKYNGTDNNIISSGVNITDLATVTALGAKADKVGSPTSGNLAALDGSGNLVDSGYSHSSFATAGHTHTAFTNDLKINTSEAVVSTVGSTGAGTTPAGTLAIKANGTTYYVITSTTP